MTEEAHVTQMHVQARFYDAPFDGRGPRPPRVRDRRAVDRADRRSTRQLIGAPDVGTEDFRLWSEWLGQHLAERGAADVEPHLSRFAATALDRGTEPEYARLVADRTQPEIVRARAFFKVATALGDAESVAA